ncbi:hypothetical protein Q7P36_001641 [Cladosporium allicinum]
MDSSPQLQHVLKNMAEKEPTSLPTPSACLADFCLIPIGTPTASVSNEVAAVQRLLKKAKNIEYTMHSAGTTLEGPWDEVMRIIGQAHTLLHANGVVRIQSDIRVGSRTDKKQSPADKVAKVEALLAADGKDEGEGKKGGQMTKKDGRYVMEEEGKEEEGKEEGGRRWWGRRWWRMRSRVLCPDGCFGFGLASRVR